jgi:AraC-like DNA-binding protein
LAAIAQAERAFPNAAVEVSDDGVHRSLQSRVIANHAITHIVTPQTTVEACGRRAMRVGFGNRFKLLWQLAGVLHFESAHRSFALRPGEMIITPLAWTYRLEMDENSEGLVLMFDPATRPSWTETVHREMGKPIAASGAIAASAGGVAALLRHGRDETADALAVHSLVDIALVSLDTGGVRSSPELLPSVDLARARLMVAQNIADESYGPDRLARDLGLSRRSLYNRFDRIGLSPACFIRRQRLERARAEIVSEPGPEISLTTIALRNGFSDSSSFSRAFKAAFGISPSGFRALKRSA